MTSRHRALLALACAAQFMVVLDVSIVNVALPSIQAGLGIGPAGLPWVVNAYALTFAGLLLLGGRLADVCGLRRVFAAGLALFTLASLAGGLAGAPGPLIAARAFQGIGAALLAPATLTVVTTAFADDVRPRALAAWTAVGLAGGTAGNLIGGVLTDALSWRWILLVNVPVGVLLTAGAAYAVTESRKDDGDRRMDLPGALAITAGLILLVYGIVRSEKEGWGSPQIIVSLGLAVVLLVLFAVNEARRRDRHPLVPLGIFRNRSVTAANLVAFSSTAALWGTFFLFTLLLQLVLGYSPLETGFAYLPLSLGIVVAARGIAPLVPKTGPRPLLVAGLLLSAAGLAWLSRAGAGAGFLADLFGPTLVLGVGQGLVSASMTVAGTSEVGYREQGLVSGLLNTSRQVGGALGLGILAVVAAAHTSAVAHGGHATERALAAGFDRALLVSALFPLLGVAAALAVPKVRPDQERDARG